MRSCCCILVVAALLGCATEEPGINPPRDGFYFPTGVALDPVRPILYVTNSNADLMYNGATLTALDLRRLPADLSRVGSAVKAGSLACSASRTDTTVWECDASQFVQRGATIRMGDFPGGIEVSSDGSRLFVPVRGQNYLLWADVKDLGAGQIDIRCATDSDPSCNDAGTSNCEVWDCDSSHRVDYSEELRQSLPTEPFGVMLAEPAAVHVDAQGRRRTARDGLQPPVDATCAAPAVEPRCVDDDFSCCEPAPDADHVYVTHLGGGEVSFFTSEASRVVLRDIRGGFFTPSSGDASATAMAAYRPGDPEGPIYVSSRVDNRVAAFVIENNQRIIRDNYVFVGTVSPGNDARGLAFGPKRERMYVVNRRPPVLLAMDMRLEDGVPREEPVWAVEVCAEPSVLALGADPLSSDPDARLAYVVCFGASQIYVVDTEMGILRGQITTGSGPNALQLDPARKRAYVANFLDNTVGVIDLDPGSASYRRMVLRIGLEENLVRN